MDFDLIIENIRLKDSFYTNSDKPNALTRLKSIIGKNDKRKDSLRTQFPNSFSNIPINENNENPYFNKNNKYSLNQRMNRFNGIDEKMYNVISLSNENYFSKIRRMNSLQNRHLINKPRNIDWQINKNSFKDQFKSQEINLFPDNFYQFSNSLATEKFINPSYSNSIFLENRLKQSRLNNERHNYRNKDFLEFQNYIQRTNHDKGGKGNYSEIDHTNLFSNNSNFPLKKNRFEAKDRIGSLPSHIKTRIFNQSLTDDPNQNNNFFLKNLYRKSIPNIKTNNLNPFDRKFRNSYIISDTSNPEMISLNEGRSKPWFSSDFRNMKKYNPYFLNENENKRYHILPFSQETPTITQKNPSKRMNFLLKSVYLFIGLYNFIKRTKRLEFLGFFN